MTSPPPPASDCTAIATLNYYHKLAGRAFSTGNVFAPDYFANGSHESMPGSTYGTTSLYSDDGGNVWHVGGCS